MTGVVSHPASVEACETDTFDLFWRLRQASLLNLRTFQIIHFHCRLGDGLMLLWQKQRASLFLNAASLPVTSFLINLFSPTPLAFAINPVSYWTLVCSFYTKRGTLQLSVSYGTHSDLCSTTRSMSLRSENWKQLHDMSVPISISWFVVTELKHDIVS